MAVPLYMYMVLQQSGHEINDVIQSPKECNQQKYSEPRAVTVSVIAYLSQFVVG